ncbi:fused response regulator/phosphatase [Desulfococcaceae bacterium HSG9]|nr:fused response regulator/phosphatase [Desulfococcaceae bacterium HSG9]
MNEKNNRIIVIDDDASIRATYKSILCPSQKSDTMGIKKALLKGKALFNEPEQKTVKASRPCYELTLAVSGEEGVHKVRKAADLGEPFAIAFVDMNMSGINGAQTAAQIWQIDPSVHIVIVTASRSYSPENIAEIAGRTDLFYLTKPFNHAEIRQFARVLSAQWNINKELDEARQREIGIAARIQQSLLIGTPPTDFPGLEIVALTVPSLKVDGDFYDFHPHSENCLDIMIGDVMGKGVPAALLSAGIKETWWRVIANLSGTSASLAQPDKIVAQMDQKLVEELMAVSSFFTLCYARFDLERRCVTVVDCGHPKTIHFHHSTQTCSEVEGLNIPMGLFENQEYKSVTVGFEPGDVFFLYSDGISEAQNLEEELYGPERIAELIQNNGELNPKKLIERIQQAISEFSEGQPFTDDVTCVAVKIGTGTKNVIRET